MVNPFKYGVVVRGEDFADREGEVADILRQLEALQSIILYSPRRYGKTSLMVEVLRKIREKGFLTALIDFYGVVSASEIAEKIVEEVVAKNYGRVEAFTAFLRNELGRLRPQVTANPDGSFGVSLRRDADAIGDEPVFEEVLDAPQKVSEDKEKFFVVVYDEFQEITGLNGERMLKIIRSKLQHHNRVAYVFMGSKIHVLAEIFAEPGKAFYRSAKPYQLGAIPKQPFSTYIRRKFEETNVEVEEDIIRQILDFTNGHPYSTQQFSHEVWDLAAVRGRFEEKDLEDAVAHILDTERDFYTHIWDGLSLYQRRALAALASEETENPYSSDYVSRQRLTSASHVQKALNFLFREGLVVKENGTYRVSDVFLREWMRRMFVVDTTVRKTIRPRRTTSSQDEEAKS
ncbi:MAG: ATP-binding protein [Candidatus Geothermarchaeales archaeon]